jgi:hypothetical protein
MPDNTVPNQASNKSKAEGERDTGGISNRPLSEEEKNQESLPDRGESREGAHAGHGDSAHGSER